MEEYVDVLSDKYTKLWKRIMVIRFVVRISICTLICLGLVVVVQGLAPYVNGTEEWAAAPFTLSQINAILCLFVWVWLCCKAMKMYSRL